MDGEPWSLPAVGMFLSAVHMLLTVFSSYLVGRLNLARIQNEWSSGAPLVPRFAMTGATAIHSALAVSAGCFSFRRRIRTLNVVCDAKRLLRRATETFGNKIESGIGFMGRYSFTLIMAICMAKAETALHMLVITDFHMSAPRVNTTTSFANITEVYDDLTPHSNEPTSEEPPSNDTSEPKNQPAFMTGSEEFFSSFFHAHWAVPSWLQQAPFMWVQLASIASEGQMTALCAVLKSSVSALNNRLVVLLGRRGEGLARAGGEEDGRQEKRPLGSLEDFRERMAEGQEVRRAGDSSLRRGWSQWFNTRKRNRVAAKRRSGARFYGEEWRTHGAIEGEMNSIKTAVIARKPLARELGVLRRLYGSMMDLHDGINRRFGDELLVNTIAGRLAAVLTLYATLFLIFDHRYRPGQGKSTSVENRNSYLTLYLLILFFQLLVYLSRLIYVCYACHRVCNAVARTRVLLQEFKGEVMDRNSSRELAIFTAQLESRNVEFSAGGFFAVDLKFLHSILGSLFTYLIILIQFQTP